MMAREMSDVEFYESGAAHQSLYDELMAERAKNKKMREALELVRFGLTHEQNKCWPTTRPWTKKERDAAMLGAVRGALSE